MAVVADELIIELRTKFEAFARDMNSAAKNLSKFESQFSKIGKGLGAALSVGLGAAALAGIKKITDSVLSLAEKGDRLDDIRSQFLALGGDNGAIQKASDKALGMVSAFDLMATANKGLLAGLPGLNQNFETIVDVASRVADATGGDAKESIDSLMAAIIKGTPKALAQFGVLIEKGASTEDIFRKLKEAQSALAPVSDSVANAQTAVGRSFQDAIGKMAIYINNNEQLRVALRNLETTLSEIDLVGFAKALGVVATAVVNLTNAFVKLADGAVQGFEMLRLDSKFQERLGELVRDGIEFKEAEKRAYLEIVKPVMDASKALEQHGDVQKNIPPLIRGSNEELDRQREEVEKLTKEWNKLGQEFKENLLKEKIQEAIKSGDRANFESLILDLQTAVFTGSRKGFEEFVDAGVPGATKEMADNMAVLLSEKATKPFVEDFEEKMKDAAETSAKAMEENAKRVKDAYRDFLDGFSNLFNEAEETFGLKIPDGMKRAVDLAQGLISVFDSIASILNSFGTISASISGGGLGGIGGSIASGLLGAGGIGAITGGAVGGYGSGFLAGLTGTTTVASTAAGASGVTAGATALAAVPYIAGAVALYAGLDAAGVFKNKRHPDTDARKDVIGFLEERVGRNILAGPDSRFNTEAGFSTLHSLDKDTQSVFNSIGNGLNALLGITRGTGEQIGAILADDVGGTIDGLKLLIGELGISFQEFEAQIIAQGIEMNKTWLEIEGTIAGVERAFKPGLDAVGAVGDAVDDFIHSEGRGLQALQSLRNIAIEAMEDGAKSMQDFRAIVEREGGLSAEAVDQLFLALKQRGITKIDQLVNSSDRTAGAVVADVTAMGFAFEEMTEQIKQAVEAMQSLNTQLSGTPTAGGFLGGTPEAFAKGGIISSPTLSLMGEAGPEAILPLTRKNGVLGVAASGGGMGGGFNIFIDARGADSGVEQAIRQAVEDMHENIVMDSVNRTLDTMARQGMQ